MFLHLIMPKTHALVHLAKFSISLSVVRLQFNDAFSTQLMNRIFIAFVSLQLYELFYMHFMGIAGKTNNINIVVK